MRTAVGLFLLCAGPCCIAAQDRRYDPQTVDTVKGEVTAVQHHPARSASGRGVHLMVKTAGETIEVDLGPEWYIDKQDTQITAGDQVTVTGSRLQLDGAPAMVALLVEKDGDVLELRDERGIPRWAGWRGRWRDAVVPGRRSPWWSPGSRYERLYDVRTFVSLSGEVASVGHFTPRGGAGRGAHLVLKTDQGTIPVHLGPEWYIDNQDLQIEPGNRITVTGSRIEYEGKPALIAAAVEKGEDALELRDAEGMPRWAGWRRGRQATPPEAGAGARWWAAGSAYERHYDAKSVVTLSGKVESFHYFTPRESGGRGLHLVLKTAEETVPVHLGPAWYLERQDLHLAAGDEIAVTGSRVDFEGKPALIAGTIQKGDQRMELRDELGYPRWAAWRRR
jgi:hypothetical protein